MDKEFDGDYEIWGGDLDPEAVELAGATRSWPRWMTS